MKKTFIIVKLSLLFVLAKGQMIKQNVEYTKIAMFSGKPIVQDTCFIIKNGTDTIWTAIRNDSAIFKTNASNWGFYPSLPSGTGWALTGNTGITSANFLGTTDSADLVIKTKGIERSRYYANGDFINNNTNAYKLVNTHDLEGFGVPFTGAYSIDNNVILYTGITDIGDVTSTIHAFNTSTFQESEVSVNRFASLGKQGVLLKSTGNTGGNMVGITSFEAVQVHCMNTADTLGFSVTSWSGGTNKLNFAVYRNGLTNFASMDSATLYAITPAQQGGVVFCNDCTGNGITGRIVTFIASAWRKLKFE